jgi:hypothetical protein
MQKMARQGGKKVHRFIADIRSSICSFSSRFFTVVPSGSLINNATAKLIDEKLTPNNWVVEEKEGRKNERASQTDNLGLTDCL